MLFSRRVIIATIGIAKAPRVLGQLSQIALEDLILLANKLTSETPPTLPELILLRNAHKCRMSEVFTQASDEIDDNVKHYGAVVIKIWADINARVAIATMFSGSLYPTDEESDHV